MIDEPSEVGVVDKLSKTSAKRVVITKDKQRTSMLIGVLIVLFLLVCKGKKRVLLHGYLDRISLFLVLGLLASIITFL